MLVRTQAQPASKPICHSFPASKTPVIELNLKNETDGEADNKTDEKTEKRLEEKGQRKSKGKKSLKKR